MNTSAHTGASNLRTRPSPHSTAINRSLATLALCALIGAASSGSVRAAIPGSERQVLIDIYNSTGGANWTNKTGWLGAPGTECTWFRVFCDARQEHVQKLHLYGNNLVGLLPSVVGLTELVYLQIYGNQLTGTIPSMAGMVKLQAFYAQNNQFSGTIPSLAGLTNLKWFYVHNNQLSGPIPSLAGLTNLTFVDLRDNQLSGSIPSLAGLANLFSFDATNNRLTGQIPSLSGLTSLNGVLVGNNLLTGNVPNVPNPNALRAGASRLCPNVGLNPVPNAGWDVATGQSPWYQNCAGLPDPVYKNGFD